jgi:hypothetical protein
MDKFVGAGFLSLIKSGAALLANAWLGFAAWILLDNETTYFVLNS